MAVLAARCGASPWVGGFLAAWAWPLIYPTGQLVPPALEALLIVASFLALDPDRPARSAAAGALLGLVALSRQQAMLAIPAAAWALRGRPRSAKCYLSGAAAVLSLWVLFVRARTGEWSLVAPTGGLNFYLTVKPGATGEPAHFPGYAWMAMRYEPERLGIYSLSAQDAYFYAKAAALAVAEPFRTLALWARRCLMVVADPAPFTRVSPDWLGPFPSIGFAVLFGLGMTGLAAEGAALSVHRWLLMASWLALSLPIVTERYRILLVPSLALGAAAFLSSSLSWRKVALACALAAVSRGAGALLVTRPAPEDLGVALAIQARYGGEGAEAARRLLEDRRKEAPDDPEVLYHLGELYATLGDFERAEPDFDRLAELKGGDWPPAWGLVSTARAALGDWKGAAEAAHTQYLLDPRDLGSCMDGILFDMLSRLPKGGIGRPDACPSEHHPAPPDLEFLREKYGAGGDPSGFAEALLATKLVRLANEGPGPAANRFREKVAGLLEAE